MTQPAGLKKTNLRKGCGKGEMDDKTLQRKLNRLVSLANELDDEAKRRYGKTGTLFFEADGAFHIMADDVDGSSAKRQEFVRASSHGYCRMGSGAW